jgi:NADPH2:quinone reductase
MRAAVLHEFGPAANLRYEEAEDPGPGPGQVRIAVRAAGVHLVDTTIRSGAAGGPFPLPRLPAIGGREVAGVVDAVGAEVDDAWLGRRVVAHLGPASGGYAELAVSPVAGLHRLPDHVGFPAAVAMIGTGRTAMAILEVAAVGPQDVVVVTSAAGGLGVLLVQAALDAGAVVVGAAGGPDKVERVRQLGATLAVDYDDPAWPARVREEVGTATLSLDGVGGERGRAALELLRPGGRVVFYGWSSGTPTELSTPDLFGRGITASAAIGAVLSSRPGGLREFETRALAALAAGRLVPAVTTFALAETAAAHEALQGRRTVGKVVLLP